ncbi:MAG: hypothetical protein PHV82_07130 [Victivallaceae bacterium]|nr:hypothetical protein [Victivallaceae bacterium]
MIKIVEFSINEIILEEKACSDLVMRACLRSPVTPRRVTGMCSSRDKVFVILEACPQDTPPPVYRFALLASSANDEAEIDSQISSRYYAGFRTIGSFTVDNQLWALFAYRENEGVQE